MTLIADLYALQEIDTALDQRLAALEGVRARFGDNEAEDAVRAEIAEASAGMGDLEARQRDLELQVGSLRERAAPVQSKLYGGSITNAKELTDLEKDLEQLARQRQAREDELLIVLEQLEGRRAVIQSATERLRVRQAEWAGQQAELRSEETRLDGEIDALRARRQAHAAGLPPAPLASYDRLRQRRKGQAVVRVERSTCQGCRLTIPAVILQRARSGMNLVPVQCPSCERMLYVL